MGKTRSISSIGITIPEILDVINQQNVIVPGGKFGAEPAPPGTEFTYTVRLPERFNSAESFEEIVVRTMPDGSQVKIGDIARVNLGVETYSMIPRLGVNLNEETLFLISCNCCSLPSTRFQCS